VTSESVLRHYTAHSLLSDPGPYASHLGALPHDMDALHRAINGLLIHIWKVRAFSPEQLASRPHAVFVRSVKGLLEGALALNAAPLDRERPEHERLIVDCRSFALLLCAALRRRGIPARVRCGFAGYLEPSHLQDHWVCEFWNGERWAMEDPDVVKHDLSADDFVTGVRAWSLVRTGEMAAERFGFGADAPSRGPFAVRLNLLRDAAALCGFESVSGDMWGLALRDEAELTPADHEVLGNTARLAGSDGSLLELWRYAAAQEGVRVPETVRHFDYVAGRSALLNWRDMLK
jgi:hypothetical protein